MTPTQPDAVGLISLHTSPLAQAGAGDGGGMNVFVRQLATALAQRGIDTVVFARRTDRATPDVVHLEPGLSVVHLEAGPHDLTKADLGETIMPFAEAMVDFLRCEPGLQLKVLHANYWLSALAGAVVRERLGIPMTVSFHTLGRVKNASGVPEPEAREQAEQWVVDHADGLCAASPADANDLAAYYGARAGHVAVVPPGVEHALFSPGDRRGATAALGLPEDGAPTVLFVGRIQPLKGADVAVQTVGRLGQRKARLVMVGGPSGERGDVEMDRVFHLAAAAGMGERMRVVPPQPHHVLSTYYRAADVVVVPSRSESFGLVALEASACGRAVVAADVGGLRYVMDNGRTGVLVAGRDPARWSAAVDSVLSDANCAAQFGAAAHQRSLLFSWRATGERAVRHYEQVLAGVDRRRWSGPPL